MFSYHAKEDKTFQIHNRYLCIQNISIFLFLGGLHDKFARGLGVMIMIISSGWQNWSCGGNTWILSPKVDNWRLYLPRLKAPSVGQNGSIQGGNNHREVWDCVVEFSNVPADLNNKKLMHWFKLMDTLKKGRQVIKIHSKYILSISIKFKIESVSKGFRIH